MKALLSSFLRLGVIVIFLAAAMALPAQENSYRDPAGRFVVSIPGGWVSSAIDDEGVKLSRGNGYCNVTHIRGNASGQDLVSQVIGQISGQWQNFSVVDQGEAELAQRKGAFAVGVGTNPRGVPAVFRISAVGTGTEVLAVVLSAPQNEFAALKQDLVRIEQSLSFGSGAVAVSPSVSEKLAALEVACHAGVFTAEECTARKKTLLNEGGAQAAGPQSRPAGSTGPGAALGIAFREVTHEDAAALKMKQAVGVIVTGLVPGGPADRAGVRQGDTLLLVDRKLVQKGGDLSDFLATHKPGDAVELGLSNSGETRIVSVTLATPVFAPAVTGAPGAPSAVRPASGEVVKFTRLSVRDPGINNIEAVSFLIPAGWKAEGGMQWFPDFYIQAVLLMKVSDPQTGATIEFLPLQNFSWHQQMVVPMPPGTNYMGAILWPPITDVAQFIRSFYGPSTLRHLQSARLVTGQDLPTVAQLVAQMNGVSEARAGRVRYEYEIDGRPWEEDVYVSLTYAPLSGVTYWSATMGYAFRAPKGQLDRLTPTMNTTINTMRLSLEWFAQYQYVQKLFVERMQQGIRNAGRISDTIHRNNEEIQQMFADSYRRSCESQDRISRSFTEYIRGVETYRNPFEDRPVQLPSGYSNVWVNGSGEYILSNQAGFNPNAGSNIEWRALQKAP
jgi:hypothetical protein